MERETIPENYRTPKSLTAIRARLATGPFGRVRYNLDLSEVRPLNPRMTS